MRAGTSQTRKVNVKHVELRGNPAKKRSLGEKKEWTFFGKGGNSKHWERFVHTSARHNQSGERGKVEEEGIPVPKIKLKKDFTPISQGGNSKETNHATGQDTTVGPRGEGR